jgi:hypothetical protein
MGNHLYDTSLPSPFPQPSRRKRLIVGALLTVGLLGLAVYGITWREQPPPITARQVAEAFTEAGLPVPVARDTPSTCGVVKCVLVMTTDAVTILVFSDEASATRFADSSNRFSDRSAHSKGPVVLWYMENQVSRSERAAYEAALAELLLATG